VPPPHRQDRAGRVPARAAAGVLRPPRGRRPAGRIRAVPGLLRLPSPSRVEPTSRRTLATHLGGHPQVPAPAGEAARYRPGHDPAVVREGRRVPEPGRRALPRNHAAGRQRPQQQRRVSRPQGGATTTTRVRLSGPGRCGRARGEGDQLRHGTAPGQARGVARPMGAGTQDPHYRDVR